MHSIFSLPKPPIVLKVRSTTKFPGTSVRSGRFAQGGSEVTIA
jgi:hypothetical protein